MTAVITPLDSCHKRGPEIPMNPYIYRILEFRKQAMDRREIIKKSVLLGGAAFTVPLLSLSGCSSSSKKEEETTELPEASAAEPLFLISLAEWSLHNMIRDGELDHLDFAKVAREEFDIEAVEYVSQLFPDETYDQPYLVEMKSRADDFGVQSLLIMVDHEGSLGDPDEAERLQTVENHRKWLDAAVFLGCHSIRVNAESSGSYEEQQKLAADGLRKLCESSEDKNINVIVENHGGLSSNGEWLSGVIGMVDHPLCGTLPDFGNFKISDEETYDRYKGVRELMPYAKAVSAKSNDFDESGAETRTDFLKMMKIVLEFDYHGHVGIEYEGDNFSEYEGIRKTKALLEKVRTELS